MAVMLIAELTGKCTNCRGVPASAIVSPKWIHYFTCGNKKVAFLTRKSGEHAILG
jgi:hypothetical protein